MGRRKMVFAVYSDDFSRARPEKFVHDDSRRPFVARAEVSGAFRVRHRRVRGKKITRSIEREDFHSVIAREVEKAAVVLPRKPPPLIVLNRAEELVFGNLTAEPLIEVGLVLGGDTFHPEDHLARWDLRRELAEEAKDGALRLAIRVVVPD